LDGVCDGFWKSRKNDILLLNDLEQLFDSRHLHQIKKARHRKVPGLFNLVDGGNGMQSEGSINARSALRQPQAAPQG